MIYDTISLYKCIEVDNLKWFIVTSIGVVTAVTATVLLVVGSVLSTQNG